MANDKRDPNELPNFDLEPPLPFVVEPPLMEEYALPAPWGDSPPQDEDDVPAAYHAASTPGPTPATNSGAWSSPDSAPTAYPPPPAPSQPLPPSPHAPFPAYPAPRAADAKAQRANGMAITALVLAILSPCCAMFGVGWLMAIAAMVLAIVAMRTSPKGRAAGIFAAIISGGVLLVGLLWGISSLLERSNPDDQAYYEDPYFPPNETLEPTYESRDPFGPQPVGRTYADASYMVGVDIEPGTYRTVNEINRANSEGCTWTISVPEPDAGAVPDVYGGVDRGKATVTLEEGQNFVSAGCLGWAQYDLDELLEEWSDAPTTVREGTWLVGPDVAPGLYRALGLINPNGVDSDPTVPVEPTCYFTVTAGWDGAPESVVGSIALADGVPTVQLEVGQQIIIAGCPTLIVRPADQLYAAAQPGNGLADGMWLGGVDVAEGSYRQVFQSEVPGETCMVDAYAMGDVSSANATRLEPSPQELLYIAAGQTVVMQGCGGWILEEPAT